MYNVTIQSMAGKAAVASSSAGPGSPRVADGAEVLEFSLGNPRVEHITGLVHLHRQLTPPGSQPEQEDTGQAVLPEERGLDVCVLTIPEDLSVADFCQFLGAHLPKVREMRFVRRTTPSVYQPAMILLRFSDQESADSFCIEYSAKPFSSLEPDILCSVVFVRDIEVLDGGDLDFVPPPGQTELPSCPVCLERLDEHISGVITTVCNHRFHNECLQQWADSSCPVCRYVQQAPSSNSCLTCGTRDNLWICLICGHVGCGRYVEAHAADHFRESGHCYSLELETQRVWDYVGDGYVHRLVRSQVDGKVVEVATPGQGGMQGDGCCNSGSCVDELEEAQIASKLDAIAQEYNHLLCSQLDSQRQYFEGLLKTAGREGEERAASATAAAEDMRQKAMTAATEAKAATSQARQLQKKLEASQAAEKQLREDKGFLASLNETLISNQKEWQTKVINLEAHREAQSAKIQDLEEQLRDMMLYIEAQQTVASEGGGELAGGTLLALPEEDARRRGRKGKGKAKAQGR